MPYEQAPILGPTKLCFLDLPIKVRQRIYILAGLVRVCPINLNNEGADKTEYVRECEDWCFDTFDTSQPSFNAIAGWRCFYRYKRFMDNAVNANHNGFDCICRPLPHKLLFVSKSVSNDVSSTLYSQNMFKVCRSDRRGLSSFFNLNPRALESMTSLCIHLNACSCVSNHQCPDQTNLEKGCPLCHYNCKPGRDEPISKTLPIGQTIILEWKMLIKQLVTSIRGSQLRLSIICDTLDYQTAEDIVKPLLELPALAECAIRLGQAPDHTLRRLAEKTALRVTGRPTHSLDNSFRFLHLPREIQWQVLAYTDLVSPGNIEWVSGRGIIDSGCCKKCTDALESCCCSLRHAAFTSTRCTCWAFPKAIFHASRMLHNYATQIFFSSNKFKVYTLDRFEGGNHLCVLKFLHALPSRSLQHIRYLHCVFDGLSRDDLNPGNEYQENWKATVDFISHNLALRDLSLKIEDTTSRSQSVENLITGRDDSAEVEVLEWKLYQRMTEPISKLSGLKNFYVHFTNPPYEVYADLRSHRETILEKRVMGEAYDSDDKFAERDYLQAIEKAARPVLGPDGTQIWPLIWE